MAATAVFLKDVEALFSCDVIVAFLDEPSLGVGAEIALAIQQEKVVIGLFRRGSEVSRFIEGLLRVSRNCIVAEYDDLADAVEVVIGRAISFPLAESSDVPNGRRLSLG